MRYEHAAVGVRWVMRTPRRQCAPIASAFAHSVKIAGDRDVCLPSTRIAVHAHGQQNAISWHGAPPQVE